MHAACRLLQPKDALCILPWRMMGSPTSMTILSVWCQPTLIRYSAAQKVWFTCPSRNEFQDDTSNTPCLLPPRVTQETWRHQHPIQHGYRVKEFPQHRGLANARNCPLGFGLVQEQRSFKLEQDGQVKCTQLQAFWGSQQLGRMQGRICDRSRSPKSYSFGGQLSEKPINPKLPHRGRLALWI